MPPRARATASSSVAGGRQHARPWRPPRGRAAGGRRAPCVRAPRSAHAARGRVERRRRRARRRRGRSAARPPAAGRHRATRSPRRATARARSWSPRGQVQAGRRQQRLHRTGPCRAAAASASTSRPWRIRRSARAMSGCQLGIGIAGSNSASARVEHRLGLAPATELDEQRGVHAVAVARQEDRCAGRGADQPVAAQQLGPRRRPARSRRRGSRR